MLFFIYYFIFSVNLLFSFTRKKSWLIVAISWVFLFFLFVSNDASGHDHYLYKIGFEHPEEDLNFEFLYTGFQDLVRYIGVSDYNIFLSFLFLLCSILQFYGFKFFSISLHPIISLYLVFIFPQWAAAIRFFLAVSIALFSFQFLIKGNWLIYLVLSICAITVHYSLVILLLVFPFFIPTFLYNMDKLNFNFDFLSFFMFFVIFLTLFVFFFAEDVIYRLAYTTMGLFIGNEALSDIDNKVSAYFETKTKLGFIMFVLIYGANLYASLKIKKLFIIKETIDVRINRVIYGNVIINKILAISVPLVVINLVFGRLMAIGTIFNLITIGSVVKTKRKLLHKEKVVLLNCFVAFLLSWAVPAVFEINSISPHNLIETAIQYWNWGV